MQTNTANLSRQAPASLTARRIIPIGFAAFLGLFLLWGVGFSHIDVLHNAAHDTRHSNAFPCH